MKTQRSALVTLAPLPAILCLCCATGSAAEPGAVSKNLSDFALARCLSAYFQKQHWETEDIDGISGGLVETGDAPLETYTRISELVRNWNPQIETKQGLDIDLVKCFHLDEFDALESFIEQSR